MQVRDRICVAVVGLALAVSVLAVGSVLRWTQAVVAILVALALVLQILSRRRLARMSPLVVLLVIAAALTALQLLPLPSGVVGALDPTGSALRADGAAIAGTHPWCSLSLDPPGSLRALAYFITLIGIAVFCLRIATTPRGCFLLLSGVAITCGLAAAVTGFHTLIHADALYGIYRPQHVGIGNVFGPLLNPNHLGGLMAIGTILSLGLSFYERQTTHLRVLWIVIGLGCAIVTAASESRGAMVGLLIGLFVTGTLLVARRLSASGARRRSGLRRDLPIAVVVGLGLALALYASAGNVAGQLEDTSLTELNKPVSKYSAWKSSMALVKESPWVGVGRGAIEPTLTRVYPESAYFTFAELENEYVSAVVEWGIPGALVLAAVFGWCIVTAARRWRDGPLAIAAIGALTMILFQSSVDFGVELLGLAVPVTIIASTVQLVPLRPVESRLKTTVTRLGLVVALLLAAGVLLVPASRSLQEDHDELLAASDPQLPEIRDSIERHPLDYFGFALAADVSSRNGDVHAVDYLNHALVLHPTHPGLHRLAARMLVGLKRYSQAAIEYSLAMKTEASPRPLLTEVVALIPNADDVASAIPVDYWSIDVMLHALHDINRQDIAEKWLVRVARQPQHDLRAIDTLYDLAMSRQDLDAAKEAAQLRLEVSHTTTSRLMLAKVQFQRHELDALLAELADVPQWTGRLDEKGAAWLILCDVRIEQRDWDAATQCLHRLDGSGLLPGGGYDIHKRLEEINEQRTYEAKMAAAKALEKSLETPPKK